MTFCLEPDCREGPAFPAERWPRSGLVAESGQEDLKTLDPDVRLSALWICPFKSSQNANFGFKTSLERPVKRKPGKGVRFHERGFRSLEFAFCELLFGVWRRPGAAKKARLRQARRLLIVPFKTKIFLYNYYINALIHYRLSICSHIDDSPICLTLGNQQLNSNKIRKTRVTRRNEGDRCQHG